MAIGYKVTVDLRGSYKNKYYNSLSEIKRKAYLTDTFAAWTFPNRKTKYFIYEMLDYIRDGSKGCKICKIPYFF